MLEGKPAIVLSYSVRYRDTVAKPVAEGLALHGFRPVLVGEEPLPPGIDSTPNDKVQWFFHHADMAVFLATPDDRLESGQIQTRLNIIDEHRLGQQLDHLRRKLLVFKAPDVALPSNINPVYERLPLDDPQWIVGRIVEQARIWGVLPTEPPVERARSPQSSQEAATAALVPDAGDASDTATAQAADALRRAIGQLHAQPGELEALQRAELAIAGLIAENGAADTLGVHLANSVFALRHELCLRQGERQLLIRTYLQHARDRNVPGIVWLKDMSRRSVIELLTTLVRDDIDEEVKAQALGLLGRLGAPTSSADARLLLLPFLMGDAPRLRSAALEYLRDRGDAGLRDLLEDPGLLERDRAGASETAALLDLARHPGNVMERYMEDAYVRGSGVEEGLMTAASRIGRAAVGRALRSPVRKVRQLGLRLAAEKRCMSRTVAQELMATEKSPWMRLQILRSLNASGEPIDYALLDRAARKRDDDIVDAAAFDEERALELDVALRTPLERLEAELSWSSVRGPGMYEALGRRDSTWAEQHVRRDLRTDFVRLREAGRRRWLADATTEAEANAGRPLTAREREDIADAIDKEWASFVSEPVGSFILRMFRRAALRVLVVRGMAATFASRAASRTTATARSVRKRSASSTASGRRMTQRPSSSSSATPTTTRTLRRAAATALRLAYKKDKLAVLVKLIEDRRLGVWAVECLAGVPGGIEVAGDLLGAEDADVRLAAAEVVWTHVDPDLADGLLSVYMEHMHFYNVVRKVDELLYAPRWLRSALEPMS